VAERLARKMIQAKNAPVRLSASTDRREVLKGASVVICTVGVGGRRGWEQDVYIPRRYGIFQPVGDTVMPGGTSRAMRMIPAMVAIARDVLELAPKALFFNYSNPMSPVCRAIRKATGAEVVGLCHGVGHVARYLAGCLGVTVKELEYRAVGLNHLTWFTEVRVQGRDMAGRLQQIAAEKLSRPRVPGNLAENFLASGSWEPSPDEPEELNPFSWELTRAFGAFPAAMDRHVTEFFPWLFSRPGRYYGKTLGTESYSFERTIARGDLDFEEMRRDAEAGAPLNERYFQRSEGEHEQVMEIIESLRAGNGRVYSANLPNRGQVPNLPPEAVLESPAAATSRGMVPLEQPPLPAAQAGIVAMRLAWVETTVEAALEGSRDKFVQALILDGAVESADQASRLADEMLAAQAAHLPWYGKK
jgi:alpha-galactosidase